MSDESEQDQKDENQRSSTENADPGAKGSRGRKVHPLMMAFATGMVVLHTRKFRRNLLFGLTLAMLVLVLVGSMLIGESLARRPVVFAIYWALCFLMLFGVLALALYDLMRVRKEHRAEMRTLDARMSADMEKLRVEAVAEAAAAKAESAEAANDDGEDDET